MGCTCSSVMYSWKVKEGKISVETYQVLLSKRREELLKSLEDFEDCNEYTKEIVNEWVALTKERDTVLQKLIAEENQRILDSALIQIHFWLKLILSDRSLMKLLRKDVAVDLSVALKDVFQDLQNRGILPEYDLAKSGDEKIWDESDGVNMSPVPPLQSSSPLQSYKCPLSQRPRAFSVPDTTTAARAISDQKDLDILWSGRPETEGDGFRTPMSSTNSADTFDSALSHGQHPAFQRTYGKFIPAGFLNSHVLISMHDSKEQTFLTSEVGESETSSSVD